MYGGYYSDTESSDLASDHVPKYTPRGVNHWWRHRVDYRRTPQGYASKRVRFFLSRSSRPEYRPSAIVTTSLHPHGRISWRQKIHHLIAVLKHKTVGS